MADEDQEPAAEGRGAEEEEGGEKEKGDAMEVEGGEKEGEKEEGGGGEKTGMSSDSEEEEGGEKEKGGEADEAPAKSAAAEGKTGMSSDSEEEEEAGEKVKAGEKEGEKGGEKEGEEEQVTTKDVFGDDSDSDDDGGKTAKLPGQKVLLGADGTLVRGEKEDAPSHALANIGDSVGQEEVSEGEKRLSKLTELPVTLPELPRPDPAARLCYVRMSKHFQAESSEWTGVLPSSTGPLGTNVVRWRYKGGEGGDAMEEEGVEREIEGNARIVQWEDGSYTVHVGEEVLEVKNVVATNNASHLYVKQVAGVNTETDDSLLMTECHGVIRDRFHVKPFRQSQVSKAIMSTISREFTTRADKSDLFIKKQVDEQQLQQELAQQESMRMRNQARSAAQKRRSGYGGGAMTEDFLERDTEEGDVGGLAKQWKQRNKTDSGALRNAKRGNVRGGKRPRDSDESSSSSSEEEAPSKAKAKAAAASSSSSSEESGAEEAIAKKKAPASQKRAVVESSDED